MCKNCLNTDNYTCDESFACEWNDSSEGSMDDSGVCVADPIISLILTLTFTSSEATTDFIEGDISVQPIDYYYTNIIARSSKVMSECRQISKKILHTGIEKVN